MDNQASDGVPAADRRAYPTHSSDEQSRVHTAPDLAVLRVPVGTNLADVERWMIFATLQKCGGNKTRAAALLGVSLKTLYNRLNAYRAQGLVMDYDAATETEADDHEDDSRVEITKLHGELTEVPL